MKPDGHMILRIPFMQPYHPTLIFAAIRAKACSSWHASRISRAGIYAGVHAGADHYVDLVVPPR